MPSPPTSGLPARRAALAALDGVLRRGETLERAASRAGGGLADNDRKLALAIAGETLRRLPALDRLIDSRTRQRLPDDSKARMVLRLALAQKAALDVPDHAIVATALPLVDGGPRRLVHGVLSALLRGQLEAAPSLPDAVAQRWASAWAVAAAAAAARLLGERPPLDLSFREQAAADAFPLGTALAPRHRRLDSSSVTALPGFAEGGWWVQDLASSLPARLVPASAERVLDLCAAPGGKTLQLAAAGHRVTALDSSESRLGRLCDNLQRTGLGADIVIADALDWTSAEPFDAVLLDAPCSATGTFRRHPEVLYRASPRIIADSAALQQCLLDRDSSFVRPGGALVYAVCSLEPDEGERQVMAFLERHSDFRIEPAASPVAGLDPTPEGWLRVLPGALEAQGGVDGFFTAHLVRAP